MKKRSNRSIQEKKTKKGFLSRLKFWSKNETILVRMLMSNGEWRSFFADVKNRQWVYNNNTYIMDTTLKKWDQSNKCFMYFYHEEFSLPINIDIDIKALRKKIKENNDNMIMATNPTTLSYYIKSDFIQKLIQGASMDDVFGFIKTMIIIILLISAISLVLQINASGIL